MNTVEVMTSESQERMLAIVRPVDLDEVLGLCRQWDIHTSVVGRVTDTGRFRVFDGLFDATPGANPGSEPVALADIPSRASATARLSPPDARPADLDALVAADPTATLLAGFPDGTDLSGSCSTCWRHRRSPTSRGCGTSTTTSSS